MRVYLCERARLTRHARFLPATVCMLSIGLIMTKPGTEVGLDTGHIVLDGDPAPTFRPMYCGQTAGRIKMPLGTEVEIGPGDIVLSSYP